MDSLVPYLGKLLAYSGIFAAYYHLFMRKETFIRWNRWYIMFAMILSAVLPLVEFTITVVSAKATPIVMVGDLVEGVFIEPDAVTTSTSLLSYVVYTVYALVVLLLVVIGVKGLLQINRLKKTNIYQLIEAARLYCCKQKIAPFSFFKNVFIPDAIAVNTAEGQQVLRHELEHVRANHSFDKVLGQLLCIVFWFNPFFWFFRKEQSMVHEFLADRACVKNGGAKELSQLILCTLYPMQCTYFGNQFFQSPIKRRLAMISKNKAKRSYLRMLLIVPVTLACLCMFAVNVESKPISTPDPQPVLADEPDPQPTPGPQRPNENEMKYEEVQVKPLFNGGDANGFSRWVAEQIVYPKEAQDKNIQGRVILQFKIGASGSIEDINLLRGVDSLLDNEALRVVSLSPRWTPGKQDGKNVRVIYTFPINFTLSENDDPKPVASNSSFTYDEVQVKPLFEDKDINGFSQWVTERIVYPKEAMDKNIQGRVVISFKIGVDGKLTDMKILRSVDPLLDKEAMRVISSSPAWTPAQQNGMKVCVIYNFPVNFSLSEST